MALKALLLSRNVVAGLNVLVLLCISVGFGWLLPPSGLHVMARLACAATAAVTILFLSSQTANRALALVVLAANAAILAGALVFLVHVASSGTSWPLASLATTIFPLLLAAPALSVASGASSWHPTGRV
jgi:hypothetical protein